MVVSHGRPEYIPRLTSSNNQYITSGRRDLMVVDSHLPVQLVHVTTKAVSSNPVHDEVYSIQHMW